MDWSHGTEGRSHHESFRCLDSPIDPGCSHTGSWVKTILITSVKVVPAEKHSGRSTVDYLCYFSAQEPLWVSFHFQKLLPLKFLLYSQSCQEALFLLRKETSLVSLKAFGFQRFPLLSPPPSVRGSLVFGLSHRASSSYFYTLPYKRAIRVHSVCPWKNATGTSPFQGIPRCWAVKAALNDCPQTLKELPLSPVQLELPCLLLGAPPKGNWGWSSREITLPKPRQDTLWRN